LLRRKAKQWMPEREVRILTEKEFITSGIRITGILLGKRTGRALEQAIRRLVRRHVQIWTTAVGPGNEIVREEHRPQSGLFAGGDVN